MVAEPSSVYVSQPRLPLEATAYDVTPLMRSPFPEPLYATELGVLYAGDCLDLLPLLRDSCVDLIFADPPFNLGKQYGAKTNDQRSDAQYLEWCRAWLDECVRVLRPGGSLFVYNLPKWNISIGGYLNRAGMEFKHWIAIALSAGMPIPGRLYPSHYSLLYYTKGKPKTFRRIRTPIEICRHCGKEIRDYGGHRHAMNPNGVTLKDVWTDIPPVRHWKFKSKQRRANALSTKVLDRVVEMSTAPGDIVLDPFGGSGTTYVVCERKRRHWIGVELDFADDIVTRLESGEIRSHWNGDFVED